MDQPTIDHSGHYIVATRPPSSGTQRARPAPMLTAEIQRRQLEQQRPPPQRWLRDSQNLAAAASYTPRYRAAPPRPASACQPKVSGLVHSLQQRKSTIAADRLADRRCNEARPSHRRPKQPSPRTAWRETPRPPPAPIGGRALLKAFHAWDLDLSSTDAVRILHDMAKPDAATGKPVDAPQLVQQLVNVQRRYLHTDPGAPTQPALAWAAVSQHERHAHEVAAAEAEVPARIRAAFQSLDHDGSGYIEFGEMVAGLFRYGIDVRSPGAMARARVAAGRDGRLDLPEFYKLVSSLEHEAAMEGELRQVARSKVTPGSARAMSAAFAQQRARMHHQRAPGLGLGRALVGAAH